MLMTWNNFTHKRQKGFTIVELMVAIVIIAIGILGHAKLVTFSMKSTQVARFSNQYNIAFKDLVQRMSLLRSEVLNKNFDSSNNGDVITMKTSTSIPSGIVCMSTDDVTSNACTVAADLAAWEVKDWYEKSKALLPSLFFTISAEDPDFLSNGHQLSKVTISMKWDANFNSNLDKDTKCDNASKDYGKGIHCRDQVIWM